MSFFYCLTRCTVCGTSSSPSDTFFRNQERVAVERDIFQSKTTEIKTNDAFAIITEEEEPKNAVSHSLVIKNQTHTQTQTRTSITTHSTVKQRNVSWTKKKNVRVDDGYYYEHEQHEKHEKHLKHETTDIEELIYKHFLSLASLSAKTVFPEFVLRSTSVRSDESSGSSGSGSTSVGTDDDWSLHELEMGLKAKENESNVPNCCRTTTANVEEKMEVETNANASCAMSASAYNINISAMKYDSDFHGSIMGYYSSTEDAQLDDIQPYPEISNEERDFLHIREQHERRNNINNNNNNHQTCNLFFTTAVNPKLLDSYLAVVVQDMESDERFATFFADDG